MQLQRDCPCASNGSQSATEPQALPARRVARSFSGRCWPFALHTVTGWWDVSCCPAPEDSVSGGGEMWNQSFQHQFFHFVLLSSVDVINSLLHCCCCEVFILSHLSHQVSLLTLCNFSTVHNSGFACLAFSSPHVSLNSLLPRWFSLCSSQHFLTNFSHNLVKREKEKSRIMEHPCLQESHLVHHLHPWIALIVSISLCNTTARALQHIQRTGQCLCLEPLALDSRTCVFNPLHCRATKSIRLLTETPVLVILIA